VPTIVQVTSNLPPHIPRGFNHQPSDGKQCGDSFGGSSLEGNSPREPPFNPLIRPFGWPTLEPCMFIPPWYQPFVVQPMSELTTKLPYMKLQYPTYVKDHFFHRYFHSKFITLPKIL